MAQEGVLSAGEHRGNPALRTPHFATTDHENPTMKATEPSGRKPVADRAVTESESEQLPPGHHAVLSPSQRPCQPRLSVSFARYSVEK
jgi:hypothetical protein